MTASELQLVLTKRTDERLLSTMVVHYSQPKGFVGRNICYAIMHDDVYYGHIVGGSATRFLPGRHEFLETDASQLNKIVNNIYFHVEPNPRYPYRNFVPSVITAWREQITCDWIDKYGDEVLGFESLVELPRSGEIYRRDGWTETGVTQGFTCKRTSGKGTDSWTGRRVWDTQNLRPKRVFARRTM